MEYGHGTTPLPLPRPPLCYDASIRLTKETDPHIVFHTDATQTVGKVPVDLGGAFRHVDLMSFSGHKMHAPKGVGGLYIRRGTACRPLLLGGHQEEGRRGGTENVPYIVGLGRAFELLAQQRFGFIHTIIA